MNWISVKDRMPEKGRLFLAFIDHDEIYLAKIFEKNDHREYVPYEGCSRGAEHDYSQINFYSVCDSQKYWCETHFISGKIIWWCYIPSDGWVSVNDRWPDNLQVEFGKNRDYDVSPYFLVNTTNKKVYLATIFLNHHPLSNERGLDPEEDGTGQFDITVECVDHSQYCGSATIYPKEVDFWLPVDLPPGWGT